MWMLIKAVDMFFEVVYYLILARIILSWFMKDPRNQAYILLQNVTEPILAPFRALSNKIMGGRSMIDLSPIFAIIALRFIGSIIHNLLIQLAF